MISDFTSRERRAAEMYEIVIYRFRFSGEASPADFNGIDFDLSDVEVRIFYKTQFTKITIVVL